jgi:hypothetical protein
MFNFSFNFIKIFSISSGPGRRNSISPTCIKPCSLYATFMKQLQILIYVLSFSLTVLSQSKEIKIETFRSSDGLTGADLFLCSDSTFFYALYGCTGTGVSKGKWLKLKNKIALKSFPKAETELKVLITPQSLEKDSFVTVKFVDLFLRPMIKDTIVLFDKNLSAIRLATDSNGVIKYKHGEYIAFLTENEEQRLESNDLLNQKVHYLAETISSYQVAINYPSQFFEYGFNIFSYKCPNYLFSIQRDKLIDESSGMVYKKN